jgi:metal-responsive CopG/Arc/MetJ family transcriptional regulator
MTAKMRRVSIYIPDSMAAFFEKYAYHRGISLSKAIRDCLTSVLSFLNDSRASPEGIENEEKFEELLRKARDEGRLVE